MIIAGLQKTSLVDYPGKICSTVFLAGCNFRCSYCHNPSLVLPELIKKETVPMHPEELIKILKERKKYIDGVCITGGEPLLNADIFKLCEEIKKIGLLVKVDTNGSFPKRIKQLIEFDLADFIAMDIKGPKEKYSEITKTNINIKDIEESVELLKQGKVDYEFRTTVIKSLLNKEDIIKIGDWIKGAKAYYLQQSNMDGKTLDPAFEKQVPYTPEELKDMADAIKDKVGKIGVRGIM